MRRMLAAAGFVAAWAAMVRWTERWGARPEEAAGRFPGDDLIASPQLSATRAGDLAAPPADVFPWLVQMGPGRAGWYSYDRIDNAGRPSARRIHPEWQLVGQGDSLGSMAGVEFLVAEIDPPAAFVIRLPPASRVAFTMSYRLRPEDGITRLAVRVRARGPDRAGLVFRWLVGPADFVMLRRQLRGLAERVGG
jgi:hypothetical protein